jgi:hypothetical protein
LQAKKNLWKVRTTEQGKRKNWINTERNRWNERTIKQFPVAGIATSELWASKRTPERKLLRGKWNLTLRRFRVATVHWAAVDGENPST